MQQIDTVVDQASYGPSLEQRSDQYADQDENVYRAQALGDTGCHRGFYRFVAMANGDRIARYPDQCNDQKTVQTDSEQQQAGDHDGDDATEADQGMQ